MGNIDRLLAYNIPTLGHEKDILTILYSECRALIGQLRSVLGSDWSEAAMVGRGHSAPTG